MSDADEDSASGDGDGGDADIGETELDAELRAALMTTPPDLPTHRPSQCETSHVDVRHDVLT